jgi:hypothetical protein
MRQECIELNGADIRVRRLLLLRQPDAVDHHIGVSVSDCLLNRPRLQYVAALDRGFIDAAPGPRSALRRSTAESCANVETTRGKMRRGDVPKHPAAAQNQHGDSQLNIPHAA